MGLDNYWDLPYLRAFDNWIFIFLRILAELMEGRMTMNEEERMSEFTNMGQIKKHFFPIAHQKEQDERAIKELGFGRWLADKFISDIKSAFKGGPK